MRRSWRRARAAILTSGCAGHSDLESSPGPILFVADLFHPVDHFAVALFLNGDVGHGRGGRSPMPVLLAGREPHDVTRANFFERTSPALCEAAARRDDKGLAERMGVPCGAGTWFEGNAGTLNKRRIGRLKKRIDPHGASEPVRRSLDRRLGATSLDFHFQIPSGDLGNVPRHPSNSHLAQPAIIRSRYRLPDVFFRPPAD